VALRDIKAEKPTRAEKRREERKAKADTMELSVGQVVDMRESLIKLMQRPLPVLASFRLAQLANALNPTLTVFQATKDKLVKELGAPIEGSAGYKVTEANMEAFNEQMAVLLKEEVCVPVYKISLPVTLEIEAMVLMPLECFLEVPGEEVI